MTLKNTYLFLFIMILLSFTISMEQMEVNDSIQLLTTETKFETGSAIVLKFSSSYGTEPKLYLSNSYGAIIIKPISERSILSYQLPKSICNKTGVVNWKLLSDTNSVSGKFYIHSKKAVATMETYLGPPSIEAGGTDFSMLVVIPTDAYDNPLKDSTETVVKHQFLANQTKDSIYIKNSISYKNIFSKTKTGRIITSSECFGKNSKEYTVNVLPTIPTNFTITYERNHEYADGNQITSFSTSIIKDKHNNVVSDGTYVDFFITNTSNHILKTSGNTINGVATAKMIHPDHQDHWIVKAFIEGMAESDSISLNYKQAVLDFQVVFSEDNRIITIGPLKSFMNQMIPDGLEVKLTVYQNDKKLKTHFKNSFEGYTSFKLNPDVFADDTYTFKIETAGIEKTFQNKKL